MKPALLLSLAACFLAAVLPASAQDAAVPKLDFGDHRSSTLTGKAWAAHAAKNPATVKAYVAKVRELYEAKALEQQASLTAPVPTDDKDKVFSYWALNDVGTALFVLGQSLEQSGDKAGALDAYKALVEKFSFAQCWDSKGWFWRPAEAARARVKALEFDAAD